MIAGLFYNQNSQYSFNCRRMLVKQRWYFAYKMSWAESCHFTKNLVSLCYPAENICVGFVMVPNPRNFIYWYNIRFTYIVQNSLPFANYYVCFSFHLFLISLTRNTAQKVASNMRKQRWSINYFLHLFIPCVKNILKHFKSKSYKFYLFQE